MLNQTRVTGKIDDDFLRRLVFAIEEASGCGDDLRPAAEVVKEMIDGDLFLAYEDVRQMMAESYPELCRDDVPVIAVDPLRVELSEDNPLIEVVVPGHLFDTGRVEVSELFSTGSRRLLLRLTGAAQRDRDVVDEPDS